MSTVKVTTAAELDLMTPAERQAHFEASIVRDLSDVPEPFLNRIRERLQARSDANRTAE